MNIVRTDGPPVIGTYSASVRIDNTTIDLSGSFEVPDPGSQSALELVVELAIKNEIKVKIHEANVTAQPKQVEP